MAYKYQLSFLPSVIFNTFLKRKREREREKEREREREDRKQIN